MSFFYTTYCVNINGREHILEGDCHQFHVVFFGSKVIQHQLNKLLRPYTITNII
jgi:hypothetical protein